MKLLPLILFVMLLLSYRVEAQENIDELGDAVADSTQANLPKITAFIAPFAELSKTGDQLGTTFGVEGNVLILRRYRVGVYYASWNGTYRETVIFPNEFDLKYGHAGLVFGYRTDRRKLIDFTGDLRLGFGEAFWENVETFQNAFETNFTLINPMVGTEVNLGSLVKVNLALGYRFFTGFSLPELSSSNLNSFTFTGTLKVGWFGPRAK